MTFINMLRDESGASAAEYALILAIVGSGIALAAFTLGDRIAAAMTGASTKVCGTTGGGEDLCVAGDAAGEGGEGGGEGGGGTPTT
jgi:pilus assembly protein Flp/PilA